MITLVVIPNIGGRHSKSVKINSLGCNNLVYTLSVNKHQRRVLQPSNKKFNVGRGILKKKIGPLKMLFAHKKH